MPIMGRYLGRSILGFTGLVMAMLMILLGIYLFAAEQDDIGVGSYALSDAFWFSLLNLPRQVFILLPIAALIGSLLALGSFARTSELTVMRAAGVSAMRLGAWAGATGVAMALAAWLIGDYVAPPLERMAREHKTFAKFKQVSLTGNQRAWAKDGDTFISVQQQTNENQFGGVYVFRFDSDRRLISIGHAIDARASADNLWELRDYAESVIQAPNATANATDGAMPAVGESIIASRVPTQMLATNFPSEFLGLATSTPDSLSGRMLLNLIRHNRANGLETRAFETALWVRVARTVAMVFLVMLAVPFALAGSARSGGGGVRMILGILVGTAFTLFAKMLEDGAVVFDLAPIVVAWAPTAVLATITLIALARIR
jgi:lipopolysaccharide export system permease protein